MCKSNEINELAIALNTVQSQIMIASKDAKNGFFKSKYATLNSVWEAVKDAVLNNGLTVLQPISYIDNRPVVQTMIIHKSGQFITSECPVVCAKQNDPQAFGSAITYARRYSLASMLGVMTDDDDDAEGAMYRKPQKQEQPIKTPQQIKAEQAPIENYKQLLKVKNIENAQALIEAFSKMTIDEQRAEYKRKMEA